MTTAELQFQEWLAEHPERVRYTPPEPGRIERMRRSEMYVSGRCVDPLCRIQMLHPRHEVRP